MEARSAPIAESLGLSRELSENPRAASTRTPPRLWQARATRRVATIQQPLPCLTFAPHLAPVLPILQLFARHCFDRAYCRSERGNGPRNILPRSTRCGPLCASSAACGALSRADELRRDDLKPVRACATLPSWIPRNPMSATPSARRLGKADADAIVEVGTHIVKRFLHLARRLAQSSPEDPGRFKAQRSKTYSTRS